MAQTLQQLQTFLNQNEIPKIKGKPKTFLGIAKQPHYENVLSNIYAFYFRVNEVHKFKDLFVTSLLACIKTKLEEQNIEKEALQSFYDFEVETEFSTNKGGRIDILLSNSEQAIIIENKVYHHIKNNDLDDYWNSVKIMPNDNNNKVGVVLSLHPIAQSVYNGFENSKHYINITHLELLEEVMCNSGNYVMQASEKYFTFLKDFYQNIINMSRPVMEQKELEFYFTNQKEINQLASFKFSVRNHIANEIEKAGLTLGDSTENIKLYIPKASSTLNKRARYFKSSNNENLMIVVVFDEMLTKKKELYLIVEFTQSLLKNRERYNSIQFDEDEKEVLVKDFYTNKNNSWAHFANKSYPVNDTVIQDLSGFILKQLEDDKLLSIYNKLNLFLENEKQEKTIK
ncbi:PD-(D/E)XK nuclease family protein [Lacinutrix undariae]